MQIRFNKDRLAEYFPEIDAEGINKAWYAMSLINCLYQDRWDKWASENLPDYMYNRSTRRLEGVMYYLDKVLECHGVEAINNPGAEHSPYWQDTVGLYLKSGDVYCSTIVADIEEREFHLTTFADFVDERVNKEYCCND